MSNRRGVRAYRPRRPLVSCQVVWNGGKGESHVLKRAALVVLGAAVVALVVAGVYLTMVGVHPAVVTGVAAGAEASTARWVAIGERCSHDCAGVASVGSAGRGTSGALRSGGCREHGSLPGDGRGVRRRGCTGQVGFKAGRVRAGGLGSAQSDAGS